MARLDAKYLRYDGAFTERVSDCDVEKSVLPPV